ncbi:unnamed protein product, partial [Meganyctiphanes norvegica]
MVLPPRERRTLSGWFAIGFHTAAFLLLTIAMFTRNWLEAEKKAYGTAMQSIGLWTQCFRSLTVTKDVYKTRHFVGCRWLFDPFTTGYDDIREMVQEPFFLTVQIFFTFAFTMALIAIAMVGMLVFCGGESFERSILRIAYITSGLSWLFAFLSVTIFGARGPDPDWMPHAEHNNLSWSFGLAVVGMVAEFIAAILFWVEWRIQTR